MANLPLHELCYIIECMIHQQDNMTTLLWEKWQNGLSLGNVNICILMKPDIVDIQDGVASDFGIFSDNGYLTFETIMLSIMIILVYVSYGKSFWYPNRDLFEVK